MGSRFTDWEIGELAELEKEFEAAGYYEGVKTVKQRKAENPENLRKRAAALAARKRDAGLTRVSVWVPADKADQIRKLAKFLNVHFTNEFHR